MSDEAFRQEGEQIHAAAVEALRKHHDKCYVLYVLDADDTPDWPSELYIQTRRLGPAGVIRFNILVLQAILSAHGESARNILQRIVPDDPIFREGEEE